MVRNIVYKWCLKLEKKTQMIKIKRLEHCWQIYLKHLFAGVMIYWLLTFMQMVSAYSPMPNCSGIKVHFWKVFPTHLNLSFFAFTRVWLEKSSSPFKDLDKFLKLIPAISFPFTVRNWKIAFEHVTRP